MIWGTQCSQRGNKSWVIYDNVNGKWVSARLPCKIVDGWNHVTIHVQRKSDIALVYQSIDLDGTNYALNISYPPGKASAHRWGVTVYYQMDGNSGPDKNTTYLDNFSLTLLADCIGRTLSKCFCSSRVFSAVQHWERCRAACPIHARTRQVTVLQPLGADPDLGWLCNFIQSFDVFFSRGEHNLHRLRKGCLSSTLFFRNLTKTLFCGRELCIIHLEIPCILLPSIPRI